MGEGCVKKKKKANRFLSRMANLLIFIGNGGI